MIRRVGTGLPTLLSLETDTSVGLILLPGCGGGRTVGRGMLSGLVGWLIFAFGRREGKGGGILISADKWIIALGVRRTGIWGVLESCWHMMRLDLASNLNISFGPPPLNTLLTLTLMRRHNPLLIRLRHNPLLVSPHIPRELLHRPIIAHPQTITYRLQHSNIVTHHQDTALELVQGEGEGVHSFNVEVVGRLVEDEDVWVREGEAGECDAGFLAAGKEFHFLEAGHTGDAEAVRDRG